jgi:O-methyltransferase involved in polyketide biosynthesis
MHWYPVRPPWATFGLVPAHSEADQPPRSVDMSVPNIARIYDYLLGGKDNFASDRQAAEELMQLVPQAAVAARQNRSFLQRAVQYLAAEAGIRQFVDIGTGLPTRGNVHQIAQRWNPESRVLYVDNDVVVVAHARALLADNRAAIAIQRDLRQPRTILTDPDLCRFIDFNEPVAVLLVAILHFISDDDAYRAVREIVDTIPSGSYLVLSHVTADHLETTVTRQVRRLYGRAAITAAPRSLAEIRRFFAGCDLVEPGLVSVSSWPYDQPATAAEPVIFYAGVGIKR